MLDTEVLEDGLDDEISLAKVCRPRGRRLGHPHYRCQEGVALVLGEPFLLELCVEVLCDLRLAARQAGHVLVLEQDAVVLHSRDLRDARAHQPRAQHADCLDGHRWRAETVLFAGGLPEEEAAQRRRLRRGGELTKLLALDLGALAMPRLQTGLGALENRHRRGILSLCLLGDAFCCLVEKHAPSHPRALEKPIHPPRPALAWPDGAARRIHRRGHCRAFERICVDHVIHQSHFFGAVAPQLLACEHQVKARLTAHQWDEALRATRAGQQPEHNLRKAEHRLR
mmetsp:Transcript_4507/g.8741  ORF Transcript_4507/g.8741 Transcript_4507/m.8741 type:complete len:283 (-) Transcript_4507:193-1041(-)